MQLKDFDYKLPKELIAQYPVKNRQKSRLLVLNRQKADFCNKTFENIVDYFDEGDALILNDTKVIPARLFGKRKTGGRVEIFLLEKKNPVSEVLLRPFKKLKTGEKIVLESGDEVEILDRGNIGRFVKFVSPLDEILEKEGHTPLPPYIRRADEPIDRESYQTVYAKNDGATASPTAGLHFTRELLEEIKNRGVKICYVTLHTSYGTFAPVKTENIEEHRMHAEYFSIPEGTLKIINETKKKNRRIFAVGTTTTRVLEHQSVTRETSGYTELFIRPPYEFRIVDCLITNFHLPKSTLLMLISAFAGKDFIFEAYRHAVEERYRFFSYGDAMFIR